MFFHQKCFGMILSSKKFIILELIAQIEKADNKVTNGMNTSSFHTALTVMKWVFFHGYLYLVPIHTWFVEDPAISISTDAKEPFCLFISYMWHLHLRGLTEIWTWITYYIHSFLWHVINHPLANFNRNEQKCH